MLIKLFAIISERKMSYYINIALVAVTSAVLDMITIGSLAQIFSIVTTGNAYDVLGLELLENYMFISLMFIVASLARLYTTYIIARIGMNAEATLSIKLLRYNLLSDLSELDLQSSSTFKREVLSEVQQVANFVIYPCLRILQILPFIIFALITFLSFLGGTGWITLLVAGFLCSFMFLKIQAAAKSLGYKRYSANESRFRILEDVFSNIRIIKILSLSSNVLNKYRGVYESYSRAQSLAQFVTQLPKFILEAIFVLACTAIIFLNANDNELAASTPIIIAAAYKLVPMLSMIVQNISRLAYGGDALIAVLARLNEKSIKEDLKNDLSEENFKNDRSLVTFKASESHKFLCRGIESDVITIKQKSVTTIIGKSGVGKTTLFDQFTGLRKNGIADITHQVFNRNDIFYVPQFPFLIEGDLLENLKFFEINIESNELEEVLRNFSLGHLVTRLLVDRVTLGGTQEFSGLSGGEMKRLFLLFAYISNRKTIFIDEPLSGLDEKAKMEVIQIINSAFIDCTVLIITHEKVEHIVSDQVIEIRKSNYA